MKNFILLFAFAITSTLVSAQEIPAYLKSSESFSDFNSAVETLEKRISESNFNLLGKYNPEANTQQMVIVFTSDEIVEFSNQFEDRGALAAPLRIAVQNIDGSIVVSMSNPEYVFNAYWGKNANSSELAKMTDLSKNVLTKVLGENLVGFGGQQTAEELAKYHYKIMMPYFTDPDELKSFHSFEMGVKTIEDNLKNSGDLKLVYKLKVPSKDIVVYGIGLHNEDGETKFLGKIGKENLAAMPYEIILQGKEATALPGKYRLALFWPELTMGQFMKIVSTPGDIKDALESLCE
jgi:uncharacterized protein (DUF302 family)